MTDHVVQDMLKAINLNDTIESLNLTNNQLSMRYIEYIEAKCKRNKI